MLSILACVFAAAPALAHDGSGEEQQGAARHESWSLIERFPGSIRFVGVVDDPSRFLLSGEGRLVRTLAAATGMLEHTARAWRGLASFYGTDPDGVIGAFLSGRVALAIDWDEGVDPRDTGELVKAADSRWVLAAEVSARARDTLAAKLRPVPRRIVRGVPLYSIEKGRFSLVMHTPEGADNAALVLIAPMHAETMLETVLGAFRASAPEVPTTAPTLDGAREHLFAARVRIDALTDRDPAPTENAPQAHLRVALGGTETEIHAAFTLDAPADLPSGRAPTELLDAAGDDAIGAIAGSSVLGVSHHDDGRPGLRLAWNEHDAAPDNERDRPDTIGTPTGVLLSFFDDHNDDPSMAVLTRYASHTIDAATADAWMRRVIASHLASRGADPDAAPDHGGRFVGAIRTFEHAAMDTPDPGTPDPDDQDPDAWSPSAVSWVSQSSAGGTDLALALGNAPDATAARVSRLARAAAVARLFDPDPARSTVLTQGWIDPIRVMRAFGGPRAGVLRPLVSKVGRLSWRVIEDAGVIEGGLRLALDREGSDASVGAAAR